MCTINNDECTISKIRKSYNDEIEKLTFKLNDIEDENIKLKELLRQSRNDIEDKNSTIKIDKEKEELFKNEQKDINNNE